MSRGAGSLPFEWPESSTWDIGCRGPSDRSIHSNDVVNVSAGEALGLRCPAREWMEWSRPRRGLTRDGQLLLLGHIATWAHFPTPESSIPFFHRHRRCELTISSRRNPCKDSPRRRHPVVDDPVARCQSMWLSDLFQFPFQRKPPSLIYGIRPVFISTNAPGPSSIRPLPSQRPTDSRPLPPGNPTKSQNRAFRDCSVAPTRQGI